MSTSTEPDAPSPPPTSPDLSATLEMLGKVLHTLGNHARELMAYGWYYVGLHVESLKLKVVWLATLALCGLSMLLVVGLALAASAVMFVVGAAQLVGEHVFAGQIAWGYLTVGAGMLVVIPLSVLVAGRIAQRVLARELRQKFARKKQLQRTKYGHDIQERAATAG